MTDSRKLTRLDVLAAISLANLFLLEVWRKLIFVTKFFVPYWSWRDLLSAAVLVSIFSAGLHTYHYSQQALEISPSDAASIHVPSSFGAHLQLCKTS